MTRNSKKGVKSKIIKIIINTIPIILMFILIPLIKNDYILTIIYILIITLSLFIKYENKDFIFLVFGFIVMILSEYFFIQTGVETFNRNTLLNIMPLWLPFLWAYAFVAIKRAINIIQ